MRELALVLVNGRDDLGESGGGGGRSSGAGCGDGDAGVGAGETCLGSFTPAGLVSSSLVSSSPIVTRLREADLERERSAWTASLRLRVSAARPACAWRGLGGASSASAGGGAPSMLLDISRSRLWPHTLGAIL